MSLSTQTPHLSRDVYFLESLMMDASVIATHQPIWLGFGAAVKIAHANFSLATE